MKPYLIIYKKHDLKEVPIHVKETTNVYREVGQVFKLRTNKYEYEVREVFGARHDELTFIYHGLDGWIIADSNTGIKICGARSRSACIEEYNNCTARYSAIRSHDWYKDATEIYTQIVNIVRGGVNG